MDTLQHAILNAALPHVVFDGWTMATLERGALDAGLTAEDAHRAFAGGALDAINAFSSDADARMLRELSEHFSLSTMRVRDRIATAVMVRLRAHTEQREALRRAIAYYAMPWNAAAGLKALYATVDAMWRAAGDTSTDFNFYTKRMLLSKVYVSTLYVWLDDNSPNLETTEAFLARRIENVMQIEKTKSQLKKRFADLASFKGFSPKFR